MSLPPGVTIGRGRRVAVSQRGWWTPPFTSCMFAAADIVLERAGYITPLKRAKTAYPVGSGIQNFVLALHKASGAPLTRGTSTYETQKALLKLLPDAPVLFGTLTGAEVIAALKKDAAIRVIVPNCQRLPRRLRRWIGYGYAGGHAVTIDRTRWYGGQRQVWWLDPMWRPAKAFTGEWVNWKEVAPALKKKSNGEYVVMLAYEGEVMLAERVAQLEAENATLKAAAAKEPERIVAAVNALKDDLRPSIVQVEVALTQIRQRLEVS